MDQRRISAQTGHLAPSFPGRLLLPGLCVGTLDDFTIGGRESSQTPGAPERRRAGLPLSRLLHNREIFLLGIGPFCLDKSRPSKETSGPHRALLLLLKWRTVLIAGLAVWLFSLCSVPVFAQSLGDVARQEHERKKEQSPRGIHVYTNEDLKKT
jgi:hypothetical protein